MVLIWHLYIFIISSFKEYNSWSSSKEYNFWHVDNIALKNEMVVP